MPRGKHRRNTDGKPQGKHRENTDGKPQEKHRENTDGSHGGKHRRNTGGKPQGKHGGTRMTSRPAIATPARFSGSYCHKNQRQPLPQDSATATCGCELAEPAEIAEEPGTCRGSEACGVGLPAGVGWLPRGGKHKQHLIPSRSCSRLSPAPPRALARPQARSLTTHFLFSCSNSFFASAACGALGSAARKASRSAFASGSLVATM